VQSNTALVTYSLRGRTDTCPRGTERTAHITRLDNSARNRVIPDAVGQSPLPDLYCEIKNDLMPIGDGKWKAFNKNDRRYTRENERKSDTEHTTKHEWFSCTCVGLARDQG